MGSDTSRFRQRVFISSTFKDLKRHREVAIQSLKAAGLDVDAMEEWTADPRDPVTVSTKSVVECDVFVLLVARRRGFIPAGSDKSVTQLEYEEAFDLDKPIFIFMLAETAKWPAEYDETDRDPGLNEWRDRLRTQHTVGVFKQQPSSLEIVPALHRSRESLRVGAGNRNACFSKLVRETFSASYQKMGDPSLEQRVKDAILRASETADSYSLEDFDLQDFRTNPIILHYRNAVDRALEGSPVASDTRALREYANRLEVRFRGILSEPRNRELKTYFENSDEYQLNLTSRLRRKYHERLRSEFAERRLPQEPKMKLSDIYIAPTCTVANSSLSREASVLKRQHVDIHELLETVLEDVAGLENGHGIAPFVDRHRVLVFGYPGQGKSSFCRRLAHDIACAKLPSVDNVFLLPFREVSANQTALFISDSLTFIRSLIEKKVYEGRVASQTIESELRRSLVILDGLDEFAVASGASCLAQQRELLRNLLAIKDETRMVVTSRYIDLGLAKDPGTSRPLVLRLDPFSVVQQKLWLDRYRSFNPVENLTFEIIERINRFQEEDNQLQELAEQRSGLSAREAELAKQEKATEEVEQKQLNRLDTTLDRELDYEALQRELMQAEEDLNAAQKVSTGLALVQNEFSHLDLTAEARRHSLTLDAAETRRARAKSACNEADRRRQQRLAAFAAQLAQQHQGAGQSLADIRDQLWRVDQEIAQIKRSGAAHRNEANLLRPLQELVSQPLVLYLIVKLQIDLSQLASMDSQAISRSTIYGKLMNKLTDELFDQLTGRDAHEHGRHIAGISGDEYRTLVGELAFGLFVSGNQIMSFEEASRLISGFDVMKELSRANEDFWSALLPTFYFKDGRAGAVEFAHKSFQEYLVAEKIWRAVTRLCEVDDPDQQLEIIRSTMSAQVVTVEILDFVSDMVRSQPRAITDEACERMSTIFGTRVLNEEFFREQEALPMVVCFYNSLNLLNVLGARTDFVRDDQTRSLFLELLRLFLSRYPERSLDLQHQSLHASDLSLNTTNIVFAPVETMAEYQSARTSSDAYERPSLQMSQRPTAKSTVGRKRIRK